MKHRALRKRYGHASGRKSAAAYDFLRWMSGWTVAGDFGNGWIVAHKMPAVQGEIPGETIAFLRQAPRIWHSFQRTGEVGHGTTPYAATLGGAFDRLPHVNKTLVGYRRLVAAAPRALVVRFAGIDNAQMES